MREKTQIISIRIPNSLYFFIQDFCREHKITMSDFIRDALNYYIHNIIEKEGTTPELIVQRIAHEVDELQRYIKTLRYLHNVYEKACYWLAQLQDVRVQKNLMNQGYVREELELLESLERRIKEKVAVAQALIMRLVRNAKAND